MKRRDFLATGVAALAAGCISGRQCGCGCKGGRILFGACRPLDDAALMKSIGYDFLELSVADALRPLEGDESWKRRRDEILSAALPVRSCNGFLPNKFRLTGKDADWEPALKFAAIACRRADEIGLKTIVLGSSGARNVPATYNADGTRDWPKGFSVEEGRDQFAGFCKVLADRIADCKVAVVIEPLRPNETDIIHYVWQGMQIVEEVNSPRIQQLADIYHMIMGREPADSLVKAGCHLKHCHIAEWKTRKFPGCTPEQVYRFKPYFDALKEIGYSGGVSCECGWGEKDVLPGCLETALATMKSFI